MKLAIGADHRGFDQKERIKQHFALIEWIDVGTESLQRVDYPPFAIKVCQAIQQGRAQGGILLCGSGAGMAVAANRFLHIYAAVITSPALARTAKGDDNINVIVLPSDFIDLATAFDCISTWIATPFKNEPPYTTRMSQIDAIECLCNKKGRPI